MRKAFDANVSRAKPRLRMDAFASTAVIDEVAMETESLATPAEAIVNAAAPTTTLRVGAAPRGRPADVMHGAGYTQGPAPTGPAVSPPSVAATALAEFSAPPATHAEPSAPTGARAELSSPPLSHAGPEPTGARAVARAPAHATLGEELDPRERRERLKERLRAATTRTVVAERPRSPAQARETALGFIAELQADLERARAQVLALSKELELTRAERTKAIEEARQRAEEATSLADEVAARARLADELGRELESLEGERDSALVELRTGRSQIEALNALAAQLEQTLVERDAEIAETLAEEERLASEVEARDLELARAQATIATLMNERADLQSRLDAQTKDREAFAESQRALDEIHRALSEARARAAR